MSQYRRPLAATVESGVMAHEALLHRHVIFLQVNFQVSGLPGVEIRDINSEFFVI